MRYYDSIHNCPILAFDKASKGDLKALHIKGRYSELKATEAYKKIFDEDLKEFGSSDFFKEYMDLRIHIANLRKKAYVDGDKFSKTLIKVKELDLQSMLEGIPESENLGITIAKMSKALGFHLDSKNLTVYDYRSYKNMLTNGK